MHNHCFAPSLQNGPCFICCLCGAPIAQIKVSDIHQLLDLLPQSRSPKQLGWDFYCTLNSTQWYVTYIQVQVTQGCNRIVCFVLHILISSFFQVQLHPHQLPLLASLLSSGNVSGASENTAEGLFSLLECTIKLFMNILACLYKVM